MSYYVVLIKKYVIAICPREDYENNWEILGQFNCMEQAEQFLIYVNSSGYSGHMPDNNDCHGVYISNDVRSSLC